MTEQLLVFDGDDTLWQVELLYDEARSLTRDYVESLGLDPGQWETLQRVIDVENVQILGLDPRRFPTSCAEAYARLVQDAGLVPDESVTQRIREIASSVFRRAAPLVPGAESVLRE